MNAEIKRLRTENDWLQTEMRLNAKTATHWHECFQVLERAIVGETGMSAIEEVERLQMKVRLYERALERIIFDNEGTGRDAMIAQKAIDTVEEIEKMKTEI